MVRLGQSIDLLADLHSRPIEGRSHVDVLQIDLIVQEIFKEDCCVMIISFFIFRWMVFCICDVAASVLDFVIVFLVVLKSRVAG